MTPGVGGDGSAPSPGWLMRAAHASCDATLIAMKAAKRVSRSPDWRSSSTVSRTTGAPGHERRGTGRPYVDTSTHQRCCKWVSDERLREIVAWAREHSPVDDAMARAVHVTVDVQISPAPAHHV